MRIAPSLAATAAVMAAVIVLGACASNSPDRTDPTASASVSATTATPAPSVSDGPGAELPDFPSATAAPPKPSSGSTPDIRQFLTSVFADAQSEWADVFAAAGQSYSPARLQLFTTAVTTACGAQSAEVGPFYCPADRTVYLDVSFFTELERQYGVTGDFAQAYVVAHELGHHVQTITGVSAQVAAAQQSAPSAANALSIRAELQADCYAGVWAHSTYKRGLLEPGDLDEALTAAAAVGDDFLQHTATGTIEPENWTHGSSAQRQQWLSTGYDSGSPAACDTFRS